MAYRGPAASTLEISHGMWPDLWRTEHLFTILIAIQSAVQIELSFQDVSIAPPSYTLLHPPQPFCVLPE